MNSKDRIWLLQYNGLGDAILNIPFIDYLIRAHTTELVFASKNAMLNYFLNEFSYDKLILIPEIYRSIAYVENVVKFVNNNKINKIISLRRDEGHLIKRILYSALKNTNIEYYCYEDYLEAEQIEKLHVYHMNMLFFEGFGQRCKVISPQEFFYNNHLNCVRHISNSKIGIYLGASQINKRLNQTGWIKIIEDLLSLSFELVIFGAKSEEEIGSERLILDKVTTLGVQIMYRWTIESLHDDLSSFLGIITCDTFFPHFVSAMGVPVFDIFLSTDSTIYGVLGNQCFNYQNPEYKKCQLINNRGNCELWGRCQEMQCIENCNVSKIIEKIHLWLHNLGISEYEGE